eukprot:CAMPEP_0201566906 /NCGR_PEP_ID=MMETSP0190_2-20130828/7056_1 /ASSEMBLY_ACC=CAM_ASM_000263 /TAXON_ID=37353 /ORGANISM="Rosalina sp." /LENGTH=287 /DNA_ID=CAMNT_0047986247 /DNA_START=27 /DNA_END=887 /DNA_ORIENTATION=+
MENWLDIINEEENKTKNNNVNRDNDDYIELPEPEIIDLNDDGTLQKEITYEYDENDRTKIYRIERTYYYQNIEQKISQSAINRKKNWKKFGQVANVPKGTTERGVTCQRPTEVPFLWTGMKVKKPKKPKPIKPSAFSSKAREERKMDDTASIHSAWTTNSTLSGKASGGYKLSKDRMTELLGEPVEIKISNLPQWASWDDIKRLIDAFYIHHLAVRYPPKYKIRMIPSKWTLEKWEADPIYYKNKLEDYERMAIVEFDNDKNAAKAIKILNGHRYEYCVLCVEKARP